MISIRAVNRYIRRCVCLTTVSEWEQCVYCLMSERVFQAEACSSWWIGILKLRGERQGQVMLLFPLFLPSTFLQIACWCDAWDKFAFMQCTFAYMCECACLCASSRVVKNAFPQGTISSYTCSVPLHTAPFFPLPNLQKTLLSAHISFSSAGEPLWLVPLIKTSPRQSDKKCCCQPRLPRPIISILPCRRKRIRLNVLC